MLLQRLITLFLKAKSMKQKTLLILLFCIFSNTLFSQCWKEVAAGSDHTLAIKTDGTLWAWGRNDYGQLGDGTTVNKNIPTQIGSDADWAFIDGESYNSMALKNDGSLWCWGNNLGGQVGNGNFGVGANALIPSRIGTDNDWAKISTGGTRTYAIKSNGTLWGCGYNTNGLLGIGDTTTHYTLIQIGADTDWLDISAASNQVLAVKMNGSLWGWGLNKGGSLAIGIPDLGPIIMMPTQTGNNTNDWQKAAVGGCCSSKMIKTDGSLWAMGSGAYGNLGTGNLVDVNNPVQIGIDSDWVTVSTTSHSFGIKANGTLWGWGLNYIGQLGDGTLVDKNVPINVASGMTWKKTALGRTHSIAINEDGTLYAWGGSEFGQIGDGTFLARNTPVLIGSGCLLNAKDFKSLKRLKVYPNPAKNATTINYELNENKAIGLIITNSLGQEMFSNIINGQSGNNETPIDLSAYSVGMYLLTLKTATESVTVKLIKQ